MKKNIKVHFGIERKMIAHMTSKSWKEIPHVTYLYEPDITDFYIRYKKLNEINKKITFNTLMLRTIVEGLKRAPIMNSHIYFNERLVNGHVEIMENINFSLPMIMPNGKMMSLTLYGFENKTLDEMTIYMDDLNRRIENTNLDQFLYDVSSYYTKKDLKKGKIISVIGKFAAAKFGPNKVKTLTKNEKIKYSKILKKDKLNRRDGEIGTITVTNIGSIYPSMKGSIGLIEIIPPQAVALSIGAIQDRAFPVYELNENSKFKMKKILPICIVFDHRAFDFDKIIPFCKRLDEIFLNPDEILKW